MEEDPNVTKKEIDSKEVKATIAHNICPLHLHLGQCQDKIQRNNTREETYQGEGIRPRELQGKQSYTWYYQKSWVGCILGKPNKGLL